MKDCERRIVEQAHKFRWRARLVPYLKFKPSWEVSVIPPFGGADARFFVRKGAAHVSVYLDFDGNLGAMDEPYWEIHPDTEGDCERFLLNEAAELIAGIDRSIRKQLRNARPTP